MNIKGQYKDIIKENNDIIYNPGWKNNSIMSDCGHYIAALMKREFSSQTIGLEYLAFGHVDGTSETFKNYLIQYFDQKNNGSDDPLRINDDNWVWAKEIEDSNIKFIVVEGDEYKETSDVNNILGVNITLKKKDGNINAEPANDIFIFREFSLIGIPKDGDGKFQTNHLYLVNYVFHDVVTKTQSMEFTRNIKLTFPI